MLEQFKKHLSTLTWSGKIESWDDYDILAGEEWDAFTKQKLREANIILLLVSADFLATEYIWKVEIEEALRRHNNKEARIIPVILRPCQWETTPFGHLNGLPPKGKPVSTYSNRDEAWLEVVKGITRVIESDFLFKENEIPALHTTGPSVAAKNNRVYNNKNIYKLLDTIFNDEGIQTFCFLNFEKVHNNFSLGQSKSQRLLALMDYTQRQMETEKLLALLQTESPAQFERHKPYF